MFAKRYFAPTYFAPRYFAEAGAVMTGSAIWRLYKIGSKWVFSVGQT